MSPMVIWFVLAMIVTFVEISLVTFYLLAIAIGLCAGGVAAYLDASITAQITIAGITCIVMACFSYFLRKKLKRPTDAKVNSMDIGERVTVEGSKITADGMAQVTYRGANWQAYSNDGALTEGIYLILRVDGTRLVLGEKISSVINHSTPIPASTTDQDTKDSSQEMTESLDTKEPENTGSETKTSDTKSSETK